MSAAKKQAAALHVLLMERFPQAFPQDYDTLLPLKLDIEADLRERLSALGEPVDPDLLRRVLANHTGRAGYLLALLHRPDGRRYDLDGRPAGTVDEAARAEAARRKAQAEATRVGIANTRPEAPRTDSVRPKPPAALPKIQLVAKSEPPTTAARPPAASAPAATPPRPQPPPPSAGGAVVGSYALRENANALRDYYRSQKIRVAVEEFVANGRPMFRVRIWR